MMTSVIAQVERIQLPPKKQSAMEKKMKVEIWSDVQCPFCYIGKRHFEQAMAQFAHAGQIEVEWHSFQLDPDLPKPASHLNIYQYLAERKGISVQQSESMHASVTQMAKNAGLDYHFEKAVVANSFDAHRLIQFAKTKGLGDAAEERLFHAYFTEGKDLCDGAVLLQLAQEIGLNEAESKSVIDGNAYREAVLADVREAEQIGISGVPFFVFDRKYAVSGAQPSNVFLSALLKSFEEWNATAR
ncbi:MAG: DsbA family oxidoreductase [Bacteroidota bacterium]